MNKNENMVAFFLGLCIVSMAIGFKTNSLPNGFIGVGVSLVITAMVDYILPVRG